MARALACSAAAPLCRDGADDGEHLPALAPAERPAAARRLLRSTSLDEGEREALARAMIALVADPAFAALFAPTPWPKRPSARSWAAG